MSTASLCAALERANVTAWPQRKNEVRFVPCSLGSAMQIRELSNLQGKLAKPLCVLWCDAQRRRKNACACGGGQHGAGAVPSRAVAPLLSPVAVHSIPPGPLVTVLARSSSLHARCSCQRVLRQPTRAEPRGAQANATQREADSQTNESEQRERPQRNSQNRALDCPADMHAALSSITAHSPSLVLLSSVPARGDQQSQLARSRSLLPLALARSCSSDCAAQRPLSRTALEHTR